MIKILVIITTAFTQFGGLTSVMMNYLRYINYDGIKVDILSGNDPEVELLNECKKLNIDYIKCSGRNSNPVYYMYRLSKIMKSYNVVHINANSATAIIELLPAYLAGVKTRIVHNHTSKCNNFILHSLMLPFYQRLYTHAVACSESAGDWIYGKGNYLILNNSIDAEHYKYSELSRSLIKEHYGIGANDYVIGNIGKIYKPKNHRRIIDIFNEVLKIYPNTKLVLVGDGELKFQIQQYVFELGLSQKVIFTGMKKNTQEYLSAFDCFLFPSLWEGMPLALLEAQASGLKCIASDSIDKDVAVCDTVEFLPLENDNYEWAKEVIKDYNRTTDRKITSELNIKRIRERHYDVRVNADALRALYEGNNV